MPMYDAALMMLYDVKQSFEKEDTVIARKVFKTDEYLDHINLEAIAILSTLIKRILQLQKTHCMQFPLYASWNVLVIR